MTLYNIPDDPAWRDVVETLEPFPFAPGEVRALAAAALEISDPWPNTFAKWEAVTNPFTPKIKEED